MSDLFQQYGPYAFGVLVVVVLMRELSRLISKPIAEIRETATENRIVAEANKSTAIVLLSTAQILDRLVSRVLPNGATEQKS